MNIFLTSLVPHEAAAHLDDLRLNKMILETAQLLSCGHRHLFGDHELLYRDTHFNHPCAIWARRNVENFCWLVGYFDALGEEKMYRDSVIKQPQDIRPHKAWAQLGELFRAARVGAAQPVQTDQAAQVARSTQSPEASSQPVFDFNCTEFKDESDFVVAYRKQLTKKWLADLRPPRWTGRKEPEWFAGTRESWISQQTPAT